jgi:hypothetical protein
VRVSIFGTSGFDVNRILPDTVTLGGAKPLGHFTRHINHDQFKDVTYIFRGDQISLPRGITAGVVSGQYIDSLGEVETFESAQTIYNKNDSFYSPAQVALQQRRQEARGVAPHFPPAALTRKAHEDHVDLAIDQTASPQSATLSAVKLGTSTVAIPVAGIATPSTLTGTRAGVAVPAGPRVRTAYHAQEDGYPDVKSMLHQRRIGKMTANVQYPPMVSTADSTPSISVASSSPRSAA